MNRSVRNPARVARLIGLIGMLAACVPVQVTVEMDPASSPARFESYAQAPAPEDDPSKPHYDSEIGERIQAEIDRRLRAKGYQRRPAQEAELTVSFLVSGHTTVRMVNAADPDTDFDVPEEFAEGTLVISVFETDGGKRLWRGTGETEVMTRGALIDGDPEKTWIRSVQKVLERFPAARDSGA